MRSVVPAGMCFGVRHAARWLLLACLAIVATAHAAAPSTSAVTGVTKPAFLQLAQFQRTLFTSKDGVPPGILGITEDRDGYLWLGGETGLFRFDGVHFERMFKDQLPSDVITTLFGDKDGNVWIGVASGKVFRVHGGTFEPMARGLGKSMILTFKQMADGALWLVAAAGPRRLIDGIWHTVGPAQGIDVKGVRVTGTGIDGSYWIFATDATYRLRPGAQRFAQYSADEGIAAMANLPSTAVYPDHGLAADLIVDSYGALWIPSTDKLIRLHADDVGGQPQLVTESVKPSGDPAGIENVKADFVDRQGNVWIATPDELEQFRATRFVPLVLPQAVLSPAISSGLDNMLWIASRSETPLMSVGNTVTVHPEVAGPIVCAANDPDGSIWFSGIKGIQHDDNGRVSQIPTPPSPVGPVFMQAPGLGCNDMRLDADGLLWIALKGYGVLRWDGHVWTTIDPRDAESIQFENTRTWLALDTGKLVSIERGKTTVYSPQNGLDLGQLRRIFSGVSGLWIAGDEGVMVKVGAQFHRLVGLRGERFENVDDIVQLPNGDVWMTSTLGVYRVPAAEIRLALSAADHAVGYTLFDEADGVQNARSIATSGDGRLWVSLPRGVAWIDALHMPLAPQPPAVSIKSLNDRDVRFSGAAVPVLEKGTRNIALTYTAATLSTPSKFNFRYRLNGVDDSWQIAGDRREARYANLGPGYYTFQVEASNADGVWAKQATSLAFQILPEFYQTWWFKVLCGILVLAGSWLLHRLRIKQTYTQLDTRTRERENMARDFHDTILQSFQSLLLHVQLAAWSMPESTDRQKLDMALSVTENALTEGREKIGQLRSLTEPLEELSTDIARLASPLSVIYPMAFSMHVEGEPQPLNASAANDVHAIVGELVNNAFRHSRASALHVELKYGNHELNIAVTDDGCGVDPSELTARKAGKWGMQGMQERASRVGGRLSIGAAPSGKGTRATLKIPARFVYAKRRRFR